MDPRLFICLVEKTWRDRTAALNSHPLTRLHVHVAAKLAFWRSPTCKHRALARAAGCSKRTVIRALARLHELGLLSWTRRVLVVRGWRAQMANAYHLKSNKIIDYQEVKSSANLSPPGIKAATTRPAGQTDLLEARRRTVEARGWTPFRRVS